MCDQVHALNTFTLWKSPFQYPILRDYIGPVGVMDVAVKKKCLPFLQSSHFIELINMPHKTYAHVYIYIYIYMEVTEISIN